MVVENIFTNKKVEWFNHSVKTPFNDFSSEKG